MTRRLAMAALGVVAVLGAGACGGDDDGAGSGGGLLGGNAVGGDRQVQLVELIASSGGGFEADRECISTVLADLSKDETDELSDFFDARSDELSPDAQAAESELAECFHEGAGGSQGGLPSDDEVIDAVLEHVANYRVTGEIDEDCVRDYVRDHSHWPDFSQLASDARLNAIALDLALTVNELC